MTRRLRALAVPLALGLALAAAGQAQAQTQAGVGSVGPPPAISAKAAIVMEASTGDVLYARDADARRSIASTTKLMTVLVTLQKADLNDIYTAIDYHAAPIESQIGLRAGDRMTVRDLLRAALLPSANDAAATLAVGTLGSDAAFVREMNRQAGLLGLKNTHYANPVGLDEPGNYSSARDLATLAAYLRRDAFFRTTVNESRAVVHIGTHARTIFSRNLLLRRASAVDGVKTGRTSHAGYVLVGSATRAGVTVVTAVLGEPTETLRDNDSLALLRYGLASYRATTPLRGGAVLGRLPLRYRSGEFVDLVPQRAVTRVERADRSTSVILAGLPHDVDGPLPRGSRVGTAIVREGKLVVARIPVVTAAAVQQAGLGDRLGDLFGRTLTLVALALLLACSLPLVALRRRVLRRRRNEEAALRRARRREETPTA